MTWARDEAVQYFASAYRPSGRFVGGWEVAQRVSLGETKTLGSIEIHKVTTNPDKFISLLIIYQ